MAANGIWEAIKAAVIAVPKFLDMLSSIAKAIQEHTVAVRDSKIQEIREAQARLRTDIQGVKNDADRAVLMERLSRLESGITGH